MVFLYSIYFSVFWLGLGQGRMYFSPLPAQKPKSPRAKHPGSTLQLQCSLLQCGKYQELQEAEASLGNSWHRDGGKGRKNKLRNNLQLQWSIHWKETHHCEMWNCSRNRHSIFIYKGVLMHWCFQDTDFQEEKMTPPYMPIVNICILNVICRETVILFLLMAVREFKIKNNTRTVRRGNGERKGKNASTDIMTAILGEKIKM